MHKDQVAFRSNGDTLSGVLFLPELEAKSPALIICHGALEFKEGYADLCEFLPDKGGGGLGH